MSPFYNLLTLGLAAMASAYTTPTGDAPEGNAISQPGLASVVAAGKAFSVTWEPTTKGTVSLVLLKGPSENAVPQYAIAEKIPNNGLFVWTPKTDLVPTTDATGYGIQLIDDATGQYQYTTQFGISNPDYEASSSSSSSSWASATPSASWSGAPHGHGGPSHSGSWTESWSDSWTSSVATTLATTTKAAANSTAPAVTAPIVTGTGIAPPKNVTMVAPTGGYTPSSLSSATATSSSATRASSTAVPTQSNAANSMATSFAGLVVAGAVAVFAL